MSSENTQRIQLKCKACNGTMEVDSDKQIMVCPYCGSKEIIPVSDNVKIAQIQADTYKEVEMAKMQNEKEKEAKAEAKEERAAYKKSKFSKITMILAVLCLIEGLALMKGHTLSALLALVQFALFLASWLMGMQIIPEKKRFFHTLLAVIAFLLIIPWLMLYSGSDDKKESASSTSIDYDDYYDTLASLEAESKTSTSVSTKTSLSAEPSVEPETTTEASEETSTETSEETSTETSEETSTETSTSDLPLSNEVDPDLKAFLDSYEAFMDEYIAFMEKYSTSDDALGMLADYTSMLQQYNDFAEKADAYDPDTMNAVDQAYYLEVMGRIEAKLIKAGMSMG